MTNRSSTHLPVIGISSTLMTVDTGSFLGRERVSVLSDYIEATRLAGGVPVVLPVVEGEELIQQQMSLVDGLLLTGGYDVAPVFYGEEPHVKLEAIRPERDRYELKLIDNAKIDKKPILGICRGLQILNVAFGGSLHQDIAFAISSALQHTQKAKPEEETHTVQILPQTRLQEIFGEEKIATNSFHHQAVREIGKGLKANAYSADGLIEGIEGVDELFIVGVQWHPELMICRHPKMFRLFQSFVEAAQKRKV